MSRLANKVALITGGASGIGAAVVRRFVAEGAQVVFMDRDDTSGSALAQQTGASYRHGDVACEKDWQSLMAEIGERHGRLDVLVNNAGIVSNRAIADMDLESWEKVLGVNLTGTMLGCRAGIEAMRNNPEGPGGSIINTASTVSFLGLANDAAYTASKAGVVGLTRSVATWCAGKGLNIRCNSLHPGPTLTAILQAHIEQDPAMADKFRAMTPGNRMGSVEEIANLALYLASDESSFSTGAQFVADGGLVNAHPSMD